MADLKSTRIFGWLKVLGDADVKGELKEKGQRVYSPNNPNITTSVTSTSATVYASASAAKTAYDRGTSALNTANGKLDASAQAVDSDKLDGQHGSYYAKASQVLTNVPAGAVFVDTWRPVSSAVNSTSTTVAASASAAKTAYDRGTQALNVANTKVSASEAKTAVSNEGVTQLNINNKHFITENDGGGNFNRRVGHRFNNGDIPTEYGGHTAFHEVFSNDTIDGSYVFKIANNITGNSAITNWRTAFEVSYHQFKIWNDALVVNSGGGVAVKGSLTENGQRVYSPNNRNISTSVTSTSTGIYASSSAVKTAYDRGTQALNTANGKLGATAKAVDSAKLNGASSTANATANTVAVRNSSADIYARLFRSTFGNQGTMSGALAFRVSSGSDNYIRFCDSPKAIRTWLGAMKHYSSTGNLTVDLSTAERHIVTRWGSGNGTITIVGTGLPGTEVVIRNIRDDSGTCTITGKTMYTGEGTASQTTHTMTGQGSITFVSDNGVNLMLAEGVKGKIAS